jgi:CRISPR-associated helicase Cas3/CRISPR-associated endonuclease Cas3-HD
MVYYAHSGSLDDRSDWEPLAEHLRRTAERAAQFAAGSGLEKLAYLAGLFHDLGKYNPDFQRRLEGAKIQVDHSTAGARLLLDLTKGVDRVMAELVAYAILGHHAGLPDRKTSDHSCFAERIRRFQNRLDPCWQEELAGCELENLMPDWFGRVLTRDNPHHAFDLSVIVRMLFSCLVDADYKETERYYAAIEGREVDRNWPLLQDVLPDLRARFDAHMARLNAGAAGGEVNRLRREVLEHVRCKAGMAPGLFTLTVPTGGGKTLASLGFALDHAAAHGLSRIIYAIPFTSIIDQTARIFRDVLGEDCVLEHHSAIELDEAAARRKAAAEADWPETRDRLKLAMEDWAAPIVVTTNVQFFESLFAARTSRARKLHNVAGSVIILDEAQTIPLPLLKPCVRMLDTLARLFRCSIVLCTATQPALGKPNFADGLDLEGRELAPEPKRLFHVLRRTRVERVGPMNNDALVAALCEAQQGLVIVNSRRHALDLYRQAKAEGLDDLIHLTTRQCAAHRRAILKGVRERLKSELPCRVIATSLIEAGVDVDFPRVWRAEAGLDQVLQAAGRCNREGRRPVEASIVTVFEAPDYKPPREIKSLIGSAERAISGFAGDLQSLEAIERYFREVYWQKGEGLDAGNICKKFQIGLNETDFAFREVANRFRMIESDMQPVVVRWDEKAGEAVEKLGRQRISSGQVARELQSYVVQTPAKARALLIENGHVAFAHPELWGDQFAVLERESLYNPDVGLLWEDADYLAKEDMLF